MAMTFEQDLKRRKEQAVQIMKAGVEALWWGLPNVFQPYQELHARALAGVSQWTECWPVNQRVTSSISSQGTCLDCRPGPQ